jgi:hypothetical protein
MNDYASPEKALEKLVEMKPSTSAHGTISDIVGGAAITAFGVAGITLGHIYEPEFLMWFYGFSENPFPRLIDDSFLENAKAVAEIGKNALGGILSFITGAATLGGAGIMTDYTIDKFEGTDIGGPVRFKDGEGYLRRRFRFLASDNIVHPVNDPAQLAGMTMTPESSPIYFIINGAEFKEYKELEQGENKILRVHASFQGTDLRAGTRVDETRALAKGVVDEAKSGTPLYITGIARRFDEAEGYIVNLKDIGPTITNSAA